MKKPSNQAHLHWVQQNPKTNIDLTTRPTDLPIYNTAGLEILTTSGVGGADGAGVEEDCPRVEAPGMEIPPTGGVGKGSSRPIGLTAGVIGADDDPG